MPLRPRYLLRTVREGIAQPRRTMLEQWSGLTPFVTTQLFSSSQPAPQWVPEWLKDTLQRFPPPQKYLPDDGPATVSTIFEAMERIGGAAGDRSHHRNKLNRDALHFLMRACHHPDELETIKKALEMYRLKSIEITEETALLYVKACCRVRAPCQGLSALTDTSMRIGLWANASAWNYVLARIDRPDEEGNEPAARVVAAFDNMQADGVAPNAQTYHLVIRSMLEMGDAGGAQDLGAKAGNEGLLKDATKALLVASGEAVEEVLASEEVVEVVEAGDKVVDETAFPADLVGEYLAPPPPPPLDLDDEAEGDEGAEGEGGEAAAAADEELVK